MRSILLNILLVVFTILYLAPSHAQVIVYFDRGNWQVPKKEQSYFYRVLTKEGETYDIKEFFTKDNSKKLEATGYYDQNMVLVANGVVNTYDEGGKIMFSQFCKHGECKYSQYWVLDKPVLVNGNGVIDKLEGDGNHMIYEFRDSIAATNFRYRPNMRDSIYNKVDVTPEYPGGMEKFKTDLFKKFRFLKTNGGQAFVQFVIDKNGEMSEVKVTGFLAEKAKADVVRYFPTIGKWKPALVRGKPVKILYVQPLKFKKS